MPSIFEQSDCDSPIVSVAVITYNHEKFIAQAIESVLMQETEIQVELVIGEDCSTDGTRRIVQEYATKYPQVIRALLPERNLGMARNYEEVRLACRGKYIAWLEGDDYWLIPHKLQKQVDLMEANPHYSMCATRTQLITCSTDRTERETGLLQPAIIEPAYEISEFLLGYTVHTTSVMLRRDLVAFPEWMSDIVMLRDTCVFALHAAKGPVGYLNEVASVYRLHEGGIWTSKTASDQLRCNQKVIDLLDAHFDGRYHRLLGRREYNVWMSSLRNFRDRRMYREARSLYWVASGRLVRQMPLKVLAQAIGVYGGNQCRTVWHRFTKAMAIRTRVRSIIRSLAARTSSL